MKKLCQNSKKAFFFSTSQRPPRPHFIMHGIIYRELLRYTRKLRCTDTPTLKIFKLTIIFME